MRRGSARGARGVASPHAGDYTLDMHALFLVLAACSSSDPTDTASDSGAAEADPLGGTAALATVSGGACPAGLAEGGEVVFTANGQERTVKVLLPASGEEGAPVVFVWHPLGATATDMIRYLGLRGWADDNGAVVVVPEALSGNMFEWDFWNGQDHDLVMYDDLRTCLIQDLGVDPTRFSATGMSAGGLMTTFMGIRRGDTLATIFPMSGGTDPVIPYTPPAGPFPALLFYGGESDTWNGLDFEGATLAFAAELTADGHHVIVCNHEGGHTIPPEAEQASTAWLTTHVYGEPGPFEDGNLEGLPGYCSNFAP